MVRRQPGGTADHYLKGEVTGINTRAVVSGGEVAGAFKKALEHRAGQSRQELQRLVSPGWTGNHDEQPKERLELLPATGGHAAHSQA